MPKTKTWTPAQVTALCKKLKLSRRQLAEVTGANYQTVCQWFSTASTRAPSPQMKKALDLLEAEGVPEAVDEPGEWPPEKVVALQVKHGMNIMQFAEALGVNRGSVTHWKRQAEGDMKPNAAARRALDRLDATPIDPTIVDAEHPWPAYRVRALRSRLALTPTDFADHVGVHLSQIAKWEADEEDKHVFPGGANMRKLTEIASKG